MISPIIPSRACTTFGVIMSRLGQPLSPGTARQVGHVLPPLVQDQVRRGRTGDLWQCPLLVPAKAASLVICVGAASGWHQIFRARGPSTIVAPLSTITHGRAMLHEQPDSRHCQTSTASPAEPGGTLIGLAEARAGFGT